jgi:putative aminopeptidase FrvX
MAQAKKTTKATETPELLEKLLTAPSPSGYEAPATAVWRDAASFADLTTDGIGSTIATIGDAEASPLLAVFGHIDEIGLVITHVDEKGYLYFQPIGGWDPQILVGQRVEVHSRDGAVLGVVGRKPIHVLEQDDRKKAVELKGLHIDIGAADRDRALELIRIGDPVVIAADPVRLDGSRLVSRSMDNRLGAYVALESLRRVHERGNLRGRMAAVASVEEEIGLKGALTSSFKVRPDVALAIDVTHATDAPGLNEKELGSHEFGSGPAIGRGSTLSPQVFELLCAAAEGAGIAYTIEAHGRATGTDAGSIHISREGIPTGDLGIPLRYMHSPVEMVDLGDLEAVVELVVAFAEALDENTDLTR